MDLQIGLIREAGSSGTSEMGHRKWVLSTRKEVPEDCSKRLAVTKRLRHVEAKGRRLMSNGYPEVIGKRELRMGADVIEVR